MKNFSWKVKTFSNTSKARTGEIKTPHGTINTPAFIFCATKGALKSFSTTQAKENNTQIILDIKQLRVCHSLLQDIVTQKSERNCSDSEILSAQNHCSSKS